MKCLVTGGAGFIGSHLVDHLIKKYPDVTVIDNLCTGNENLIPNNSEFINHKLSGILHKTISCKRQFNSSSESESGLRYESYILETLKDIGS